MNPQYHGQYGQGPPVGQGGPVSSAGYGGPAPGPPGPRPMYNGQPMQGQGQFAGPGKQMPVQNGPQMGPPSNMGGPQGDLQYGQARPPGPGPNQFPQRGPAPPGGMGGPRGPGPNPSMMPGQGPNQLNAQMGNMNISGPPTRGPSQPTMGGMPPMGSSTGMTPGYNTAPVIGGGSGPPSNLPPNSLGGPPTGSNTGMPGPRPHGMGGMMPPRSTPQPSNTYGGPPSSSQGLPPTTGGYGQPNSMATGPLGGQPPISSSYGQPPVSMGGMQQPGFPPPPSSSSGPPNMGMQPPGGMPPPSSTSQGNFPPTSSYGGPQPGGPIPGGFPPTSNMAAPGFNQPPTGFPPMGGQTPVSQGFQSPGSQDMSHGQYGGNQPPQFNQGFPAPQPGRPGMPGMQPASMQQPQKRLDPDQMPSPIQVIQDDRNNRSGTFSTAGKGVVPPLVTTQFITSDQGSCNPAFLRSTMYNVPCTSDMLKNSHIPFALTISPFAKLQTEEHPPPIVNLGELGPVRCKRCKAYMNPNMMFIDGGRRFQCVFCGAATDVPDAYFAHLDHTGRRVDSYDRPELCLGSYEFVATKDYCKDSILPNAPAFIFMIDVSYKAVKCGLVNLICERLKKDILLNLPKEIGAEKSEIRVAFVTYGKEIHFYNVKGALAQPQMLVVSDVDDVFVPLLDGFFVTLEESESVIDSLLTQIPQMFSDSRETEVILGPVIQAGLDALKSADRAGKLYIFHTSLPIGEAPGKLKNRDDRKLLGTDKEKTILSPQSKFYSQLGQECVSAGCSVDVFLFPDTYCDVATISDICRLTSGNMYKYSYFQADLDGDRFIEDFKNNVQSQRAFDAIVRVRTSQGIRPVDFLGNFYMSNTTDVEMCAIDSNQAISVEIKHDDKLKEQEGAFVQVAVLFTSVSGQRRLRIHNLSLNCCTQLADLFRNCELDTFINYMSKYAIRNTLNKSPRETREHIMTEVANVLACYRKNCASPSSAGQLILPECMKLLPLYGNCVIKSDGIQGGQDISTDDRSYLMHLTNAMDVKSSCAFFYPRLIPLHDLDPSGTTLPSAMRCSAERLQDNGVYLLENGVSMFIWIGHSVDPDWIQKVFSVQSAAQIDIDKCRLHELENEISHRVRDVVNQVRAQRNRYMKLTIVRQRDKLEPWFNHFLVEDKGQNGSASYVDFLCHIHKEIRNLLN
ncbi:Protein transport protein Sec24C [Mactra antiquata]